MSVGRGVGSCAAALEPGARKQQRRRHRVGATSRQQQRHVGADPGARETSRPDLGQRCVGVRPLRQMTGGLHFNEVFLEDVPFEELPRG